MDEFNFNYADADSYERELAEFYTYSEMDEFALNFECFVKYMRERKVDFLFLFKNPPLFYRKNHFGINLQGLKNVWLYKKCLLVLTALNRNNVFRLLGLFYIFFKYAFLKSKYQNNFLGFLWRFC